MEILNRELETIKRKQTETLELVTYNDWRKQDWKLNGELQKKTSLQERIYDLKDRIFNLSSQRTKRKKKNENGEENPMHYENSRGKRERTKSVFKIIMSKNFPNLGRDENIQMHAAQKIPYALNMDKAIPRHNLIVKKLK